MTNRAITERAMPERIKKKFYYRDIWRRIYRKNRNATLIFSGDVGLGKSWAAIRFGEDLDPSFSEERVVFCLEDFLKLMDEGDSNGSLKRGSVIVFDEIAGSEFGADSRSFMSKENKTMSFISTVYRKRGYITIYCVPYLHQLDKNLRVIGISAILRFKKVDFEKKMSQATFYWVVPKWRTGELITPRPVIKHGGEWTRILNVWIDKPSEALVKKYEAKKDAFLKEAIHRWRVKSAGTPKEATIGKPLLVELAKDMKERGMTQQEIGRALNRSQVTVAHWDLS